MCKVLHTGAKNPSLACSMVGFDWEKRDLTIGVDSSVKTSTQHSAFWILLEQELKNVMVCHIIATYKSMVSEASLRTLCGVLVASSQKVCGRAGKCTEKGKLLQG